MKVALCSANIGTIDEIRPPCKQSHEFELMYFTENTLPFPLPNMDNRMKGKYFKTQSHRFLDHDVFIWVDGCIEIISDDFVNLCCDMLIDSDIVISEHAQRETVYEELVYIIEQMKAGNQYLLRRYAKQPLYLEHAFYKKSGLPKDYPLYNCYFFARWNNDRVNNIFNDWWDYILRFSNFDQSQFSFAAWKNKAKLEVIETSDLFIRHKHQ